MNEKIQLCKTINHPPPPGARPWSAVFGDFRSRKPILDETKKSGDSLAGGPIITQQLQIDEVESI